MISHRLSDLLKDAKISCNRFIYAVYAEKNFLHESGLLKTSLDSLMDSRCMNYEAVILHNLLFLLFLSCPSRLSHEIGHFSPGRCWCFEA